MELNTKVAITRGSKITGTNPTTGRNKQARGIGTVAATGVEMGHHGLVTIIRWANGVESFHCADIASDWTSFAAI